MTISKKDLQSLQKEIKALERKMDKLIAAAGKSRETQSRKENHSKTRQGKNHQESSS